MIELMLLHLVMTPMKLTGGQNGDLPMEMVALGKGLVDDRMLPLSQTKSLFSSIGTVKVIVLLELGLVVMCSTKIARRT